MKFNATHKIIVQGGKRIMKPFEIKCIVRNKIQLYGLRVYYDNNLANTLLHTIK